MDAFKQYMRDTGKLRKELANIGSVIVIVIVIWSVGRSVIIPRQGSTLLHAPIGSPVDITSEIYTFFCCTNKKKLFVDTLQGIIAANSDFLFFIFF